MAKTIQVRVDDHIKEAADALHTGTEVAAKCTVLPVISWG